VIGSVDDQVPDWMRDTSNAGSEVSTRASGRVRNLPIALPMVVALLLAGCGGTGAPIAVPEARTTAYQLGAGDKVRINVFGDESLSGEYSVDGNGRIALPLIGNVEAGGLDSSSLKARLENRIGEYVRDPKVSVEVLTYRPFYIVGEIRRPGSYPYVDGMTVINAVAIAGGFTYRARESEFYIRRQSESGATQLTAGQMNTVRPGDVIVVRERYF
jgi:polysaccharide export outer membrane protein